MLTFSRANRGPLSQWWWTIDRWILVALIVLMGLGVLLVLAASPAVAHQHAWTSFYFIKRHLIILMPAFFLMISFSFLDPKQIRRLALLIFFVSFLFLIVTFFCGLEIKGAKRWLSVGGFSLQSSEFMKPALAVLCGWMFSEQQKNKAFPGNFFAILLWGIVIILLLLQPDLGMAVLMTLAWVTQFFLAGLPILWIGALGAAGVASLMGAYFVFPHVAKRIDRFLNPGEGDRFGDQFQVNQSLEAFSHGGFFGQGPGEGTVKKFLPDAHADFIFAVGGEEFGLFFCLFILLLYGTVIFRSLSHILRERDLFIILSVSGLLTQFGLQAFINMASTLNLIPPKGMTLPFISYGGSSLLALSISMGMILGLTRRRVEQYHSTVISSDQRERGDPGASAIAFASTPGLLNYARNDEGSGRMTVRDHQL